MRKLFLTLFFTLLSFTEGFGQAQVDIPFIITDGIYTLDLLRVGLDTTATNGIDPHLGEYYPLIPPSGVIFAAFDLSPYGSSSLTPRDYRNAPSFPFTGTREHKLVWQLSIGATSFTIFYNFPAGVSANLKDPFGGILFNINFADSGSIAVPFPTLYQAILTMYYNNVGGEPVAGPLFSLFPNSLNFGEVAFGQTKTLLVTVTNMGYLDSLYISNAVSSNLSFAIEPNSFPLILAPGQIQIFNITYLASVGGTHNDSILFIHNAPGSPTKLNVYATTYLPNPNCQAQILSEVIITDVVNSYSRHLKFGLDSTASNGIDLQLGEIGPLPPLPPPGAFEAQLFLPENNFSGTLSSYCDFRYAILPYTGQKEWRLAYQPGLGSDIIISWDFPAYITGVLQDIINGTFINVPMADSGSFIVPDPIAFNRLKMLIDFNITTPVELISFNATVMENNVKLDWTTATETNNSGFEIQKSLTPTPFPSEGALNHWKTIGFVSGFGTTTEPKSYSFTDEDVTSGNYKYRLKQIDFDGSFNYLNEIEVEVDFTPKEFLLYQNYPNPFNPSTVIKFAIPKETQVNLNVYNLLGEKVRELKNEIMQPGNYEVEFDGSGLASGMYLYRIQAGEFVQIKKMILTK